MFKVQGALKPIKDCTSVVGSWRLAVSGIMKSTEGYTS